MNARLALAPIVAVVLIITALGGCGVLATPYTVYKTPQSNVFTTFRGQIVNEQGEPVWYMTRLHVYYQRYGWHPLVWDYRENHERDVKPNWKGEFEFTLYYYKGDPVNIGIISPGYQTFWLSSGQRMIWLEEKGGTYVIDPVIAFKAHPELKSTDNLKVVLQRTDEPHQPHVPTERPTTQPAPKPMPTISGPASKAAKAQ